MKISPAVPLAGILLATILAPPAEPRFSRARLSTGVQLRYAEQGDSTGDPLILLHGYSDSWFSFSRVLPLLPGNYRVYALDQRGHGDSERPATGYHMRDLAADVLAFMDARGIARATIVGHSMGGFVAQQVALLAPHRVVSLVLLNTGRSIHTFTGAADLKLAVDALTEPVNEAFVREFQASTVHEPVPPEFMDTVVAESRKLPVRVWQELMAGMFATEPASALGRARIPALVAWGEHDAFVPRAEVDALIAMLGNATLKVYANTGHTPHWERPAEFAADLQSFLSGAGAGTR